ncbi:MULTISPECIES: DUF4279 domain-containing protein [unclassified Novosphingobium]|uniref:DUF4279 domain-containing protein n=1 Tax=unclassified Novosphingobium TaxID=2644732 RepID=UPI00146C043A|nr:MULTISPECIES: DUF4279 domain-containing protein [unclassified Novosphingobium]NMN88871.1 hypothetical protein [Novosphingobium sp. SG916]
MDNLQRATVAVLITGEDLVPAQVAVALDGTVSFGVVKGEVFTGRHGKEIEAKIGMCRFGGEWHAEPDIDRQIREVLSTLTDDKDRWGAITARYFCHLSVGGYFHDWTGGLTLASETLKMLADRNLAIDFDFYAPASSR